MSGLEVCGQKIPKPSKENSTAFQLGTDDTKGYAGGSDIVSIGRLSFGTSMSMLTRQRKRKLPIPIKGKQNKQKEH